MDMKKDGPKPADCICFGCLKMGTVPAFQTFGFICKGFYIELRPPHLKPSASPAKQLIE